MSGSSSYDKIFKGSLISLSNSLATEAKEYNDLIFYNKKASDIKDVNKLRVFSWNLLAPPYKRDKKANEDWRKRIRAQIELVGLSNADVIGLQEFWADNKEYVTLWRTFALKRGYSMFVSPRTGNKADGCCMLVRIPEASSETFSYNDWGNRVVQVVKGEIGDHKVVLIQTHLTFLHPTPHDGPMRWHQGKKLGEFVGKLNTPIIILFGDMNSPNGEADPTVQNIITFGKLEYFGPKGVVSHLSHNGKKMECDFVFTSGCRLIRSWLGETEEDLISKKLLSDHRTCNAVVSLDKHERKHQPSYDVIPLEDQSSEEKLVIGDGNPKSEIIKRENVACNLT